MLKHNLYHRRGEESISKDTYISDVAPVSSMEFFDI